MNKHYEAVHKHDFLTKELLQKEYVGNGLMDREIAEKYNVSSKAIIWRKRQKFGIENKCKNKSNKHAVKNRKFSIYKEDAEKLLEEGRTFTEIADQMGCSIVVAKRRFKELGLCKDMSQTSSYEYYDVKLGNSQKQMLIGSLLGDGSITKSGAYSCSHSTKQKEYFDHKMQILYNLHSNCSQRYTHNYDHFKTIPESVHFTTGCNKYLYELRDIYYPEGKKIFPYKYLIENMEAEALAYWYQDDGCFGKNASILCTYGYSYEEQNRMVQFFTEKFNVTPSISSFKVPKERYRLRFPAKETKYFIEIVRPYLLKSMKYKIGEKK